MASGTATNTVHMAACAQTWATDTINIAFISNAVTPSKYDSDPRWGAGGAQDYSTAEVTGGNFPAGGTAIAGQTVTQSNNVKSLNATSPAVAMASNASNPASAYWEIWIDTTQSNKIVRFVDLAGPKSLVTGYQSNINSVASGTQVVSTLTNN